MTFNREQFSVLILPVPIIVDIPIVLHMDGMHYFANNFAVQAVCNHTGLSAHYQDS